MPPPPPLPETPKTSAVPVRDTVAITKNEDFLSEENDHAHDKGKTFKMGATDQLNSEWIYEVMVSPKIQTKNYRDFCTRGVVHKLRL